MPSDSARELATTSAEAQVPDQAPAGRLDPSPALVPGRALVQAVDQVRSEATLETSLALAIHYS
jgi:hypothetical protein